MFLKVKKKKKNNLPFSLAHSGVKILNFDYFACPECQVTKISVKTVLLNMYIELIK